MSPTVNAAPNVTTAGTIKATTVAAAVKKQKCFLHLDADSAGGPPMQAPLLEQDASAKRLISGKLEFISFCDERTQ
jgi:hypothetical protein